MKLFLVRHAERANDSENSSLSNLGQTQAAVLGERIRDGLLEMAGVEDGDWGDRRPRLVVLSSNYPRARQTAEIVAEMLEVESVEQNEIFGSLPKRLLRLDLMKELINRQEADVVIVVTHLPTVIHLFAGLAGIDKQAESKLEVGLAEGIFLDLETKETRRFLGAV